VTVVTEEFHPLAKSAAESLGFPDLPMVVVPHPFETKPIEEVRALAEEKFDEIIQKLSGKVPDVLVLARRSRAG